MGTSLTKLFLITLLFLIQGVLAAENEALCVTSQVTSINPSSVGFDEDFTIGIQIDNCGTATPENVRFEITKYSEESLQVKGPLLTTIEKFGYANSQRFITYQMRTLPNAIPGIHHIETLLTYGTGTTSYEKRERIPVFINAQEPDLSISRIYTTPEKIYKGEEALLVIDIENAGKGDAKDVRVELRDLPIEGVTQQYLGRIKPDENIPSRFQVLVDESGLIEGMVRLQYEFGGETHEELFPLELYSFGKTKPLHVILAIIAACLILFFIYKSKKKRK